MRFLNARTFQTLAASTLLALTGLPPQPASAATATATFQVTATVLGACIVSTPPTLAFGAYSASADSLSTTNFNVTCTVGTPYSVGLNGGNGVGASTTNRLMTSATAPAGNNLLNYSLYRDTGRTVNWDNTASGTGLTGSGTAQPYTVYGTIPAGQFAAAPAANYVDTILLTVTY